jgi:hypothetical protein
MPVVFGDNGDAIIGAGSVRRLRMVGVLVVKLGDDAVGRYSEDVSERGVVSESEVLLPPA